MKVTEAHVNARRAQILKAALSCFIVNGFQRSTMHDIAAKPISARVLCTDTSRERRTSSRR